MTPKDWQARLDLALDAAWRAGRITLRYYQTNTAVDTKPDNSPVTIADVQAEQEIRRLLSVAFPEEAVVGEEGGRTAASSRGTWYIDPIDGTHSFVAGVPLYAVLLAYESAGEVVLGVMNFPALQEMIWAVRGQGCYWNGRRAQVSTVSRLEEARLMITDFRHMDKLGYSAVRQRLCETTRLQRTWGDAYGHFLVATGRADIMIDARMAVWDCGPLLPIIQEAGGRFTDWHGRATIHGNNAFSTNGLLHEAVLQTLSGA